MIGRSWFTGRNICRTLTLAPDVNHWWENLFVCLSVLRLNVKQKQGGFVCFYARGVQTTLCDLPVLFSGEMCVCVCVLRSGGGPGCACLTQRRTAAPTWRTRRSSKSSSRTSMRRRSGENFGWIWLLIIFFTIDKIIIWCIKWQKSSRSWACCFWKNCSNIQFTII